MKDKVSQVCDYILDKIENGEYKTGEAIPSARKLAQDVGASFAMVQHAVTTLSNAGILRSINRQGTVVREDWEKRLMPNHFSLFNSNLLWVPGFQKLLAKKLPDLRLCKAFNDGMFEIRTTLHVQEHRNEYLDLAPYFKQLFPDPSLFFEFPFKCFKNPDGSMSAIPFIFSPRVMFYNKNVLKKANCPFPEADWQWEDFIKSLKFLKKKMPTEMIINYISQPYFWMNFVFRCGGALIEPNSNNPVRIDSPETCAGIQAVRELCEILENKELWSDYREQFINNKTAFLVCEREMLCEFKHHQFDDWGVVPLPTMPGGKKTMAQATDLICIRKDCVDTEMIFNFISFMLSKEVQDYIAEEKYGIPILKSSAGKTIDLADKRDLLFLTEMNNMSAEYNLDSPELMTLVQNGINQIIKDQSKPLKESLKKLADAIRIFLEIKTAGKRTA